MTPRTQNGTACLTVARTRSLQPRKRMRLDRALTTALSRISRILPLHNSAARVVVLMYHSISQPNTSKASPYYETCTSPSRFAQHMEFLHNNNYCVIPLDELSISLKKENSRRKAKPDIIITFDDGFKDFKTEAAPILKKFAFPATVFLPTAFIGEDHSDRKSFKKKECLTWAEVRHLCTEGFTFGSHSANHIKLINATPDQVHRELQLSKRIIEEKIKKQVHWFAYPFAIPIKKSFIQNLTYIAKKQSYKGILTTSAKTIQHFQYLIPRIPVNDHDDILFFKEKINGFYNWMYYAQLIRKFFKTKTRSVKIED